jgi:DNA repair ATPase RecN
MKRVWSRRVSAVQQRRACSLCAKSAQEVIAEQDDSLSSLAGLVGRSLQELARIDPLAKPLVEAHGQLVAAGDLRDELSRYSGKIEVDPNRLRESRNA